MIEWMSKWRTNWVRCINRLRRHRPFWFWNHFWSVRLQEFYRIASLSGHQPVHQSSGWCWCTVYQRLLEQHVRVMCLQWLLFFWWNLQTLFYRRRRTWSSRGSSVRYLFRRVLGEVWRCPSNCCSLLWNRSCQRRWQIVLKRSFFL